MANGIGRPPINIGPCLVEDCDRPAKCRGWCPMHYDRWRRNGDPLALNIRPVGHDDRCVLDGCDERVVGEDWCGRHYARWKRTGDPLGMTSVRWTGKTCAAADCDRPVSAHGYCKVHYERVRRGRPLDTPIRPKDRRPAEDRFWSHVDPMGPIAANFPELGRCWIWLAAVSSGGYGAFNADGKTIGAHVWAYRYFIGAYDPTLHLDHFACDNGAGGCVNPYHCRPVTNSENVQRAMARRRAMTPPRTHCKDGHELTPENTYVHVFTKCKICAKAEGRARAKKRRKPKD